MVSIKLEEQMDVNFVETLLRYKKFWDEISVEKVEGLREFARALEVISPGLYPFLRGVKYEDWKLGLDKVNELLPDQQ